MNDRPDLDEAFGIAPTAVAERPDLDEAFGIAPKPAVADRPDLDEAFGITPTTKPATAAPKPGVADLRRSDEQEIAAMQKPVPAYDPNAQPSYRDIASRYLGTGTTAQEMSGNDPGTYQKIKGDLNQMTDSRDAVAQALRESGGDIDRAITVANDRFTRATETRDNPFVDAGSPFTVSSSLEAGKFAPAAEQLTKLKAELDAAGVPAAERSRIIGDAAKANAWTEKDTDNVRKLSTGELAINPGRLFGQKDSLITDINASDTTPEAKEQAIKNLDSMRSAAAEKLANDLYYGDVRIPGTTDFREFQDQERQKGIEDNTVVLDKWISQQKDRNPIWKAIDAVSAGIAKGEIGVAKTVVGGLAGAAALTGAPGAETLAAGQQLLGDTRESVSQAEKLRGANGITNDIADTVTQMAPMFASGAYAQGLTGLSQKVVQGMSVYGWAAAQGYESKLSDAVDIAKEKKGSDLTPQEVTEVLGRRETQVAGLLNGFQTAILSKVLGGGSERAALGKAAESMTVRDLVAKGGMAALRDKGLKTELTAMAKTVLKDATDESVEEFTNQVLDSAISTVALGKDMKLGDLMEESLQAGALGGLVGGALPQIQRSPAENAARDLIAGAAPLGPQSAAAALETGTVLGTDGKPISTEAPTLPPPAGFTNDNEQPTPTAPLEVPMPAVPTDEAGAAPESAAAVSEAGSPPVEGTAGPTPIAPLTDETPNLETPTAPTPAPAVAPAPQEAIPEGVPPTGLQPTSGGPAVAGSESLKSGDAVTITFEDGTTGPGRVSAPTPDGGFLVVDDAGNVMKRSANELTSIPQSSNEPTATEGTRPSTAPETAADGERLPAESATPTGADETATTPATSPRQTLLSELGKPADPAFPDKVTTPEGAVLELTADGGKVKASITVPPENRRKGAGTAAMQKLVDLARRDGVTIDLDVEPTGANPEPGMGKEELTSWYAKFGFTDNGDGTMTLSPETASAANLTEQAQALEGFLNTLKAAEVKFGKVMGRLWRDANKARIDAKLSTEDARHMYVSVNRPASEVSMGRGSDVGNFLFTRNPLSLEEVTNLQLAPLEFGPYFDQLAFNGAEIENGDSTFLVTKSIGEDSLRLTKLENGEPAGHITLNAGRPFGSSDLQELIGGKVFPPSPSKKSSAKAETPLDPNPPTPELPNFEAALEDDSVTGLYHAQTDADRARLGLPPRFTQPRTTDQEAWDRATAAEDAHRAAGLPGTAGTDLLTNLLNDVPRVLTKDEHALLLHEKLVREQAVEKSQAKLNSLPATTTEGERKDAQAAVKKAQDAFDLLVTYADAAGSRAGLSLQARKMLVNTDFSLAAVVNRLKAAKNMNSDKPTTWTEKDQSAAVEISEKLRQAQERIEALEAGNNEQTALIEQLTKDVGRAQTKLENRMRTSRARTLVNEKLNPLVEAAKARMAERAKARTTPTDNAPLHSGLAPDTVEDLKDIAIIASGWIANKALTLEEFSRKLTGEFGDWLSEHAQSIFRQARSLYIETAESVTPGGESAPTPASVVENIDATEPLDKGDVWKLARAHVIAGLRGRNVLDAVFGDLLTKFPDVTREEVSNAFTGYGTVVYPSDKEVPKELRRIRSLEREYAKQLDIAKGLMPKRTGYQGDTQKGPQWAEVRAEQQKSLEALRELENQLREAGLPVPSDERKLANALGTMKRRLTNEIEEIELALASKTPRTPKSRTPITPDAEVAALQKKLDEKRAEYEQVFKDESAREKRILGSLKKRTMELERRMQKGDFGRPPAKEPINSEAKRKADYEFAKTRARYEEMRNKYLLDNATLPQKAGHYLMSTGNLLKLLTLGGDIGVVMRQLGTTYQAITRDLGMLAPTKEGAKKRGDGSYLKRILTEGAKSFASKEYEHGAYERLMERSNAGWDKTAGLVLSAPFDIQRNSKEDIPAANLLDSIPWYVWPAFAGLKVSLLGASFPVSASLLALGAVTKPFMQALDRAQRTMTNESRAMFFDEALANLHDGHPTVQEAKAIAKAVMVGTGRGTATQNIEAAIPFANQVLLATRYYISRIQALSLYPLLNKDARSSKEARREIQRMYGRSVAGRAVLYGLAAAAFGKALTGGDDDPEEGLIIDPRNPNFGRLKLAEGVSLDFGSGLNNFASAAVRYMTKTRVDPSTGRVIALGAGFTNNVNDEAMKFLQSKLNLQFSFATKTWAGQYFGGKPVTFANALEEISTAIIVNDTFNTYQAMMEEYGPVVGAARATVFLSLMFGGAGTSVYSSEAEKEANAMAKREAEWARKLREAELNE